MEYGEWVTYLESVKRYSRHTIVAYETDVSQATIFFTDILGLKDWGDLEPQGVRAYIVNLSELGVSGRSIRRKMSSLSSLLLYLRKRGVIDGNPMELIEAPQIEEQLPEMISERDLKRLLSEMAAERRDFVSVRNHLLIKILYYTGMRRAELINLRMKDIDKKGGLIKVLGKRDKERQIPVSAEVVRDIEEYEVYRIDLLGGVEVPELFVTERKNKLYPKSVYQIVKDGLEKITLKSKRSPHVLRHSFATHLLDHGADLNAVKELLGHSSLAATQVYTHNSIEKLKKVYLQAHPKSGK